MAATKTFRRALAEAKTEFPPITTDSTNPHFKSKFASLKAIVPKVEPILNKHGIGIIQSITNNAVVTEIALMDDAEQGVQAAIPLPATEDPQKLGSAITYYRRYAIVTLLGLVTEEDDDGNAASAGGGGATRGQNRKSASVSKPPSPVAQTWKELGWLSQADLDQKHHEAAARVSLLNPHQINQCRVYRETHGWPMSTDQMEDFSEFLSGLEAEND
jgi:hypothetical protein